MESTITAYEILYHGVVPLNGGRGGNCALQGTLGDGWRCVGLSQLEGCYWHLLMHPIMRRTAPTTKNDLVQNVNSVKLRKPALKVKDTGAAILTINSAI